MPLKPSAARLLCLLISLISFAANATDFSELNLSSTITNSTNYNNVSIVNTNDLSSGSVIGGYVYFSGSISGNVDFTNDNSIISTHSNYGVLYMPNLGNSSELKNIDIANSGVMTATGDHASSIYLIGKTDGFFPSFTRRSFNFSLNNSGTISGGSEAIDIINGNSGINTINNSGYIDGGSYLAISITGGESTMINNSGSAAILAPTASDDAIYVNSTESIITNSDNAFIKGTINAAGDSGTKLSVINSSSDGIEGAIFSDDAELDVTNNSGTITGNITLGSHANSSVTLNGGNIVGDISMGNADQIFTFSGGNLSGTINGAGKINVDSNTVLNGNIGDSSAVSEITISSGKILNALTNDNSIAATNINLGSGSTLEIGDSALVGNVNGTSDSQGRLNVTSNSNRSFDASIGSIHRLAAINFTTNSSAEITLNNSLSAAQITIDGTGGTVTLGSSVNINGDVIIGDSNALALGDGSEINGTIRAAVSGNGSLQTALNSSYAFSSDIGTSSFKLHDVTILGGSTLETSGAIRSSIISISNDATLTSSSTIESDVELSSDSTLNLEDGANLTGDVYSGGILYEGIINTSGAVAISGGIGTGYSSISQLNVASGSRLTIGNRDGSHENTIDATNINITGELDLLDATTIRGDFAMIGSSSKINFGGYSQSITGDFSTESGSTISSTIHSASSIDSLTVSGAALIDANTKLSLTIASGVTLGSSYTLISGGSGSSINSISTSNININGSSSNRFGRYVFETSVLGYDLLLTASISSTAFSPKSSNNAALYNNIMNIDAGSSGALYQMQQFLNSDASDEAKDEALKSVLPQVDNSNNRLAFNSSAASIDVVASRLGSLNNFAQRPKSFQVASTNLRDLFGFNEEKSKSFWSQVFGSNLSQGNRVASEGYSANLRGLAFGVDKEISENSYFGISLSYANSNIKSRSKLKNTSINANQLNIYHGYNFDKFFLNSFAGFVWNEYQSSRFIPVSAARAQAKYSGQTYVARFEFGANQKLENEFLLTPTFALNASRNFTQDYSENGAGSLNLNVKSKSSDFFETRAGIALSNKMQIKTYEIFPNLSTSYGYDFAHSKQRTSANFIGQTSVFDSSANKIARGSLRFGFGAKIYSSENLFFDANYSQERRQSFVANSIAVKMTKKF